jgi:hypothetical protein
MRGQRRAHARAFTPAGVLSVAQGCRALASYALPMDTYVHHGYTLPMPITASQLRADVYRTLDRAIAAGEVIEIERNGHIVRLVPPRVHSWLDQLPRREGVVVGNPEDLVHIDWTGEWRPGPL